MVGGWQRHRGVHDALSRGTYEDVSDQWIGGLTIAGAVLAIGTLALILVQA